MIAEAVRNCVGPCFCQTDRHILFFLQLIGTRNVERHTIENIERIKLALACDNFLQAEYIVFLKEKILQNHIPVGPVVAADYNAVHEDLFALLYAVFDLCPGFVAGEQQPVFEAHFGEAAVRILRDDVVRIGFNFCFADRFANLLQKMSQKEFSGNPGVAFKADFRNRHQRAFIDIEMDIEFSFRKFCDLAFDDTGEEKTSLPVRSDDASNVCFKYTGNQPLRAEKSCLVGQHKVADFAFSHMLIAAD